MLSTSLSLLGFIIFVVGGCWWLERNGTELEASPAESTTTEDQTLLAATGLAIALSDTPSCPPSDHATHHSACSDNL